MSACSRDDVLTLGYNPPNMPPARTTKVAMATTSPAVLMSGPPEFPGTNLASVCSIVAALTLEWYLHNQDQTTSG